MKEVFEIILERLLGGIILGAAFGGLMYFILRSLEVSIFCGIGFALYAMFEDPDAVSKSADELADEADYIRMVCEKDADGQAFRRMAARRMRNDKK